MAQTAQLRPREIQFGTVGSSDMLRIASTSSAGVTLYGHGNVPVILGNVANPVANLDVANKQYVDNISSGLSIIESAHVSSAGIDIPLATLVAGSTVDGIVVDALHRVLLRDQTNQVENGMWVVQTGPPVRPADFGTATRASGKYAFVDAGETQRGKSFVCTSTGAVIGTHNLSFVVFTGRPAVRGGSGLVVSGTDTLNVHTDDTTLEIFATDNTLRLKAGSVQPIHLASPTVTINTAAALVGGGTITLGQSMTLDLASSIAPSIISSAVTFSDITNATAIGIGAVIMQGGLSVGKSICVGGNVVVGSTNTGTTTTSGSLVTMGDFGCQETIRCHNLHIFNPVLSSNPFTGCARFSGGIGVFGNIIAGKTVLAHERITSNATEDATGPGTGCIVGRGGLSVAKALHVGTTATVVGALHVLDTTPAISTAAGAVIVEGGLAVKGAVFVAQPVHAPSFFTDSDARLKENVQNMDAGACLEAVLRMRPVTYNIISTGEASAGFIAQELLTVVPDAVRQDTDTLSVDYSRLVPRLVGSITYLTQCVENLHAELLANRAILQTLLPPVAI